MALYVHIPFCVSLCPYCDFVVYAGSAARGPANRVGAFLDALERELELRADALDERFGSRAGLRSVYFGGGTPSLLPAPAVSRLLALIRDRYALDPSAEVTVEANPGPDERGDLVALAAAGVNRVSFGAQSFDHGELTRLGRRHTPADIAGAVRAARDAGIGSINLDLLYDVPGQSVESWRRSLEGALELAPEHLSLYALTLDDPDAEGLTSPAGDHLPTSSGARRWRERARLDQDEDRAASQYSLAFDVLAADGWRGYELSNWARPGHESRHNLAYWERLPYEAVGPGAHAFDGRVRRWNAARLDRYVAALTPGPGEAAKLPPGGSEALDESTAAVEEVILSLRLDRGVTDEQVGEPRFAAAFAWALESGLAERFEAPGGQARLRLTVRGRLLSNELFTRLL